MDSLLPWFALKEIPGIGNLLYRRLIERFESVQAVLQAPREQLLSVEGVSERLAARIRTHRVPESIHSEIQRTLDMGYRVVTYCDSEYPELLREIPDPPPYLYVSGRLQASAPHIAVVGSRNATPYGLKTAHRLSSDLAWAGLTVVSGMARGIDTAAHAGALVAKGRTVAVLGSGLERVYPAENRSLFEQISEKGAVISEFPLSAKPEAHHFPMRNRIISGMTLGTVVVEATRQSGSLITARLAAEQNREVFAVPGSIASFKSTGTHQLLKQGAKLVEHAGDVIDEIRPFAGEILSGPETAQQARELRLPPLLPEEEAVVQKLGPYPRHIDEVVRQLEMQPGKISGILLNLELKGWVQQLPGKLFLSLKDS